MFFSKKNSTPSYNWSYATTPENIDTLIKKSHEKPLVIFKHSGRCNISAMALNRFEDFVKELDSKCFVFMIDVVNNRPASLHAAEKLGVTHQSPQVLVVDKGRAVFYESHGSINGRDVLKIVNELI